MSASAGAGLLEELLVMDFGIAMTALAGAGLLGMVAYRPWGKG